MTRIRVGYEYTYEYTCSNLKYTLVYTRTLYARKLYFTDVYVRVRVAMSYVDHLLLLLLALAVAGVEPSPPPHVWGGVSRTTSAVMSSWRMRRARPGGIDRSAATSSPSRSACFGCSAFCFTIGSNSNTCVVGIDTQQQLAFILKISTIDSDMVYVLAMSAQK